MIDGRKVFEQVLKKEWTPELRLEGFRSHGLKLNRVNRPFINCVWIQTRSTRDSFCVNLGIHLDFMPAESGRTIIDAGGFQEPDCAIRTRLAPELGQDYWWSCSGTTSEVESNARDLIRTYGSVGRSYFERYSSLPGPFADISPEGIATRSAWLPGMTVVRTALFMTRLYDHLSDASRAADFAEAGIELARGTPGIRAELGAILEKHRGTLG